MILNLYGTPENFDGTKKNTQKRKGQLSSIHLHFWVRNVNFPGCIAIYSNYRDLYLLNLPNTHLSREAAGGS